MIKPRIRLDHAVTLTAALLTFAVNAAADDWPQWRGPHRDGISAEKHLLQQWPKDGPPLVWKATDLGSGYSTPSVVADRLYVLGNSDLENESIQARQTKDGTRIWSARLGKVGNPTQNPNYPAARSTPTVESSVLYALGSDGDLVCVQTDNGQVRWSKQLRSEFGGQPGVWAYAESPLIDGDVLVCTPGGKEATIIALNKADGALIWKCPIPEGDQAAYASAIVVNAGGVKQYVQFLQKALVGVDAKTGKLLWRYERTAKGSPANIPTPVASDGYIYSGAGMSGGGLIKLTAAHGKLVPEEITFSRKLPTSIGGAVKVGDYLYGTTGQAMVCAEFTTGTPKWEERALGAASLCYADGRIYLHGENGEVGLVEASPAGYREKGRFTPTDQPDRGNSKAWTYPVVANGRLYVRDAGTLWCFDVQAR